MKSRKPTGHIVIFLETDLSKFKGFDESKLSTVQKMCFDQLSEQEKEKIRMGYGTSIIDCESEETICKFNMETYRPPKHALESFARSLLPIVQEFYEDENHMKEFEEWKKKRDKEKKWLHTIISSGGFRHLILVRVSATRTISVIPFYNGV